MIDKVVLELSVDDANRILTALSKMPYEYVNALIGRIHTSVTQQLQAPTT